MTNQDLWTTTHQDLKRRIRQLEMRREDGTISQNERAELQELYTALDNTPIERT